MNLTITVKKDVLKRARIRARMKDTSINALLREFLASYAKVAVLRAKPSTDYCRCPRPQPADEGRRNGLGMRCMIDDRSFVDTNVFVYLLDSDSPARQAIAGQPDMPATHFPMTRVEMYMEQKQ